MLCCQLKLSLFILSFFISAKVFAIPEKDTGNLGEIRQSLLNPENFQKIYGDGWVLMDGRDVQDTDLYRERLWENHTIPDSRGRFLRCHNRGRGRDTGNPDGDVGVGDSQADQIGSHSHSLPWDGSPFISRAASSCELKTGMQPGWAFSDGGQGGVTRGNTHQPGATGGNETRPRCITVNTFIKVNRTSESHELNRILGAIEKIPERLFQNGAFAQLIRRVVPGGSSIAPALEVHRAPEVPVLLDSNRRSPPE